MSDKQVWLMQRRQGRVGKGPGKTTGWIHRSTLQKRGVNLMGGVTYQKISEAGLHITFNEQETVLNADNIIICAGQESVRPFEDKWASLDDKLHVIGGADLAGELDAVRAIRQGTKIAMSI